MPPLATTRVWPSGEQCDLVRADAVGRQLTHAPVAARRVIHADHAALAVEIVLAGVEQPPVVAEHAVTVEMAPRARFQLADDGALREVEHEREAAGPPGKMHGGTPVGADGE